MSSVHAPVGALSTNPPSGQKHLSGTDLLLVLADMPPKSKKARVETRTPSPSSALQVLLVHQASPKSARARARANAQVKKMDMSATPSLPILVLPPAEHAQKKETHHKRCELCNSSVASTSIQKHIETNHPELLCCPVKNCDMRAPNMWHHMQKLMEHCSDVHGIKHRPFKCQRCPKAYKSYFGLRTHARTHSGVHFKCSHEGCTYTSYKKCNVTEHMEGKHSTTVYTCEYDECNATAKTRRLMNLHVADKHKCLRYKCKLCDYHTGVPKLLQQHASKHMVATHGKGYKCTFPSCSFASMEGSSYARKGTVLKHYRETHGKLDVSGGTFMQRPPTKKRRFADI